MREFNGFHPTQPFYSLPAQFFSDLLPQIDNLAELKVTLFCFWAIWQREGSFRYLSDAELARSAELRTGLQTCDPHRAVDAILNEALAAAVRRGTLLAVPLTLASGPLTLYLFNSERGRRMAEQLRLGNWRESDLQTLEILPERPNIYALYEQNIGVINGHIADELKDAEHEYPAAWIADAIKEATENNAKSWRYVRTVLENWKQKGRLNHEKPGRIDSPPDDYKLSSYDDFIKT